jgi:putative endonuclease
MAFVYIIYSQNVDVFYVGSCSNVDDRLEQHNMHLFSDSFTRIANDWQLFWSAEVHSHELALKIEKHIKNMKSRKYYSNIKSYPEILEKLIEKYDAGSCR